MSRQNLYDAATAEAVIARIDRIPTDAVPSWGSMNPAQMLAHCAEVQEVMNGKPLHGNGLFFRLIAPLIKRAVVSDRDYPRNSQTHPQYIVADDRSRQIERDRLVEAIRAMVDAGPESAADARHALFGTMTAEEKGWAAYKHLNHHLHQFAV